MEKMLLMTPGPTNVPDRVLETMKKTVCHHRTREFESLFGELNEGLKAVFQTETPVLTFPAAGTGGMEAAIANFFSAGDKVLIVSIGVFGDRFIQIAKIFGLGVEALSIPWGRGVYLDEIKKALKDEHKALILTHNETSTGASNPIQEIGVWMKGKDQLFIVDAISSLGGSEIRMDEWNIDVLIAGSQKALMTPPGLAFVGVSERAWEAAEKSALPKFYWDLKKARKMMEGTRPQTPYTPAVALIGAAGEAVKMILEEGLEQVFQRHQTLAAYFRREAEKLNLQRYTDENFLSDTITAFITQEAETIKKRMESEQRIIIAGGQGNLKGQMIRIGHMGAVNEEMIARTLKGLKAVL